MSSIIENTILTGSDSECGDHFGSGVALSSDGSVLAVGAPLWDGVNNDEINRGGVYIYDLNEVNDARIQRGSVLTPPPEGTTGIDPSVTATVDDRFGRSVALSSDGSYMAVSDLESEQGRDYIYDSIDNIEYYSTEEQYSLSANLDSANEGNPVTITLQTTNVDENEVVPFTIGGSSITLEDFVNLDSLGAGQFTVGSDGTATFNLEINSDSTTEGPETFTVTLDDHPEVFVNVDIN